MSPFFLVLAQCAVLAYALIGGAFLAFSDFIMRSLAQTTRSAGVETMQSINREVYRWIFMSLFLGMAVASLLMAGYAVLYLEGPIRGLILSSGLIYFFGCFGVTAVCNVPMNEALAGMDASSDEAQAYWTGTYLPRWTWWNTVRTIACVVSSGMLLMGLSWLSWEQ